MVTGTNLKAKHLAKSILQVHISLTYYGAFEPGSTDVVSAPRTETRLVPATRNNYALIYVVNLQELGVTCPVYSLINVELCPPVYV
jgi:hypothetical protein